MNELGRRMVFSASRLTYQIDTLCRRGWVRRENATEDRRGSYAVLTDEGNTAFEAAAAGHSADIDELFYSAVADDDDATVLANIMRRLADNLNNSENP